MAATYIPIATQTISSPSATVTFSSIPSTCTDLVLVASLRQTTTNQDGFLRFNSDTGTNYSDVVVRGNGSTASSVRDTSAAGIDIGVMSNSANASGEFETVIINIMNYANTTTNKTVVLRTNQPASIVNAIVGMWRSTAAINTVSLESRNAGSFAVGSTFSLYGITSASVGAKATGGVISNDGTYYYHTFTSSGTFTPSQALTADYLVIAGGGGGGGGYSIDAAGGGGGAGGLRSTVTATGGGGSLESGLSLASGTGYTVTIGSGGAGGTGGVRGTTGNNSVFSSITSSGGGGGGAYIGGGNGVGLPGGSGGGGGNRITESERLGGAGTANQGYAGATGSAYTSPGGGGGGAGAAATTKNGATGVAVAITGTSVTYAGGGGAGGGSDTPGTGGAGGGGAGSGNGNGVAATANTGGGGGGASTDSGGPDYTGGNGGSGLVIVRYPI